MLTTCSICALPLSITGPDDDGAWCSACLRLNFGGQSIPEVDVPQITAWGLGRRRAAYERIALRHLEEDAHHAH